MDISKVDIITDLVSILVLVSVIKNSKLLYLSVGICRNRTEYYLVPSTSYNMAERPFLEGFFFPPPVL